MPLFLVVGECSFSQEANPPTRISTVIPGFAASAAAAMSVASRPKPSPQMTTLPSGGSFFCGHKEAGMLIAPGTCPRANKEGLRTSITVTFSPPASCFCKSATVMPLTEIVAADQMAIQAGTPNEINGLLHINSIVLAV